jgi:hypothetical protein
MTDLGRLVRRAARSVGRQLSDARREFSAGRATSRLPTDDDGRARIVCRRYAEQRAVRLVDDRPDCYDADHPACEGCAEDVLDGSVETW